MDNQYVVMFAFWPAVVLLCAGINMLVSWTFSWSELVFDYFIGVLAGYFLFAGTQPGASEAHGFFLVFSHGLFGFLWLVSESFRTAFDSPASFFWTMAGIRVGCTLWAAAWDHVSVALGAKLAPGPFFFSFVVAPAKLPFAWVTSGFGILIWLAGLVWSFAGSGKAGFAGGVLFDEFSPGGDGHYATTVGFSVHTWHGDCPFEHELYHTRQYIYMCDWLIPFWVLGMLWGVISAAATSGFNVSYALAIGADPTKEVGNPIEIAARHM